MTYHQPVLLKESIEYLNLRKDGIYADATLGGGGHTEAMLRNPLISRIYAFDQDEDAIRHSQEVLRKAKKVTIIKANFAEMRTRLALEKVKGIDGVLFDLGVSSHQLDEADRGFSFGKDADLDMRMDQSSEKTAKDLLNTLSVEELTRIFRTFGEEQNAFQVANWIVKSRTVKPIETTKDLAGIIEKNMQANPINVIKTKARIFQALRIHLNREMEVLDSALEDAINLLNKHGRLVVISYHSLEDRLVKTKMSQAAKGCVCPKAVLKCVCNQKPRVKILTNKVITPSEGEQKENSRSRSAKLRAVEKL